MHFHSISRLIKELCLFLFVFSFLTIQAQEPTVENMPNIVLIMADDLGSEALGAYGGTSYKTPVLDKLAREGARFDQGYAYPLCTPTRVSLMTGNIIFVTGRPLVFLIPRRELLDI